MAGTLATSSSLKWQPPGVISHSLPGHLQLYPDRNIPVAQQSIARCILNRTKKVIVSVGGVVQLRQKPRSHGVNTAKQD